MSGERVKLTKTQTWPPEGVNRPYRWINGVGGDGYDAFVPLWAITAAGRAALAGGRS